MAVRKLAGLETEYGFLVTPRPGAIVDAGILENDANDLAGELVDLASGIARGFRAPNDYGWNHHWLPNGGLVYVDAGLHPEYATPETADPFELVHQHFVGDALFAEAVDRMNAEDIAYPYAVFKGNVDAENASFGTHENYLIARDCAPRDIAPALGSFLATRTLFTGVGGVEPGSGREDADGVNEREWRFTRSPRARFIQQLCDTSSQEQRPLVNERDESHVRNVPYRRLHLICGEANRCPTAALLKVGTTAVLLAMIEDGVPLDDLTLRDPVEALQRTASTRKLQRIVLRTVDGRKLLALDHQRELADRARDYVARRGHEVFAKPGTAREIVELWQTTLDQLAVDPQLTVGTLDWTTKQHLFEAKVRRLEAEQTFRRTSPWRGEAWATPGVRSYDLRYGELGTAGMFERLRPLIDRSTTALPPVSAAPEILRPPRDSRAALRGLLVRLRPEVLEGFDWAAIRMVPPGASEGLTIALGDPFRFSERELTKLRLDDRTGEEVMATLLAAGVRHEDHYRSLIVDVRRAQQLLGIAPFGTDAEAALIHDGVTHGLRNFIRSQILNGQRTSLAEVVDLAVLAALGTNDAAMHTELLVETLAECRLSIAASPGRPEGAPAAIDLAEWALVDALDRHGVAPRPPEAAR